MTSSIKFANIHGHVYRSTVNGGLFIAIDYLGFHSENWEIEGETMFCAQGDDAERWINMLASHRLRDVILTMASEGYFEVYE